MSHTAAGRDAAQKERIAAATKKHQERRDAGKYKKRGTAEDFVASTDALTQKRLAAQKAEEEKAALAATKKADEAFIKKHSWDDQPTKKSLEVVFLESYPNSTLLPDKKNTSKYETQLAQWETAVTRADEYHTKKKKHNFYDKNFFVDNTHGIERRDKLLAQQKDSIALSKIYLANIKSGAIKPNQIVEEKSQVTTPPAPLESNHQWKGAQGLEFKIISAYPLHTLEATKLNDLMPYEKGLEEWEKAISEGQALYEWREQYKPVEKPSWFKSVGKAIKVIEETDTEADRDLIKKFLDQQKDLLKIAKLNFEHAKKKMAGPFRTIEIEESDTHYSNSWCCCFGSGSFAGSKKEADEHSMLLDGKRKKK